MVLLLWLMITAVVALTLVVRVLARATPALSPILLTTRVRSTALSIKQTEPATRPLVARLLARALPDSQVQLRQSVLALRSLDLQTPPSTNSDLRRLCLLRSAKASMRRAVVRLLVSLRAPHRTPRVPPLTATMAGAAARAFGASSRQAWVCRRVFGDRIQNNEAATPRQCRHTSKMHPTTQMTKRLAQSKYQKNNGVQVWFVFSRGHRLCNTASA